MLGAGAAIQQATIKLELDWVKCPAISGISHCQVIKWDQDTCSSASVLDPWQRRSDLFSCHGFMMEINPEMPFQSEFYHCKKGHSHGNGRAASIPVFAVCHTFKVVVEYIKAENRPCLVGCLNKSQCHEPFYSMTILHYDFCDTGPLFSRLVVFLRLYQMY